MNTSKCPSADRHFDKDFPLELTPFEFIFSSTFELSAQAELIWWVIYGVHLSVNFGPANSRQFTTDFRSWSKYSLGGWFFSVINFVDFMHYNGNKIIIGKTPLNHLFLA